MLNRKSLIILLILAASVFSGCRTGLFGTENVPIEPVAPAAPPAPLVVDGVRTSYADVVEKTAPAVVSIEAEGRTRAESPVQDMPQTPLMIYFPHRAEISGRAFNAVWVRA